MPASQDGHWAEEVIKLHLNLQKHHRTGQEYPLMAVKSRLICSRGLSLFTLQLVCVVHAFCIPHRVCQWL